MAEINSVVLVGRLTRDAELKYSQGGMPIAKFSLAINRRKKVGETWTDEANFFDVTMMGKSAESVHRFLVKGKMVGVQGELRQNRWEQDGQPRSKVEIFAFSLQLLSPNTNTNANGGSPAGQENRQQGQDGQAGYGSYGGASESFEDDVPF